MPDPTLAARLREADAADDDPQPVPGKHRGTLALVDPARLAALEAVAEAARASLDQSAKYIDSGDIRMSESLWWPIKDALAALDRVRDGGSGAGGG